MTILIFANTIIGILKFNPMDQTNPNQQQLDKLYQILDQNLQNDQFGVNMLASEAGLSISKLNRILKSATGKSGSQFTREYRLEKAMELLRNRAAQPTEVAYLVGFKSPSYFSTCFKELYGFPPSEVKHQATEKGEKKNKYKIPVFITAIIITTILSAVLVLNLSFSDSTQQGQSSSGKVAITVMPFENLSTDPENEYISKGIEEGIQSKLAGISQYHIIPGKYSPHLSDDSPDLMAISSELKVDYLLEGSVRKVDNDLLVSVSLINTKTGKVTWNQEYRRQFDVAIIEIEIEIAERIVKELQTNISDKERNLISYSGTHSQSAREFYWRSRHERELWLSSNRDPLHLKNAYAFIELAIEADPGYIDPYISKATTFFYSGRPDSMYYYCKKALNLDPDHAYANNRMARYYQMYGDIKLAERHFLKALEYWPNHITTNIFTAQVYCQQLQEIAKGYPYLMKAMDLIGDKPIVTFDLAEILADLGRYDLAEQYLRRFLNSSSSCRRLYLIGLLIEQRHYQQALSLLESACQNSGCNCDRSYLALYAYQGHYEKAQKFIFDWKEDTSWVYRKSFFSPPLIGYVYKKMGQKQKANQYLKLCLQNNQYFANKNKYQSEPDFNLARIYAWQNKKDEAIRSIRNMMNKRLSIRFFDIMAYDPMFDPIRDEPEFIALMEEARLRKEKVQEEIKKVEKSRLAMIP